MTGAGALHRLEQRLIPIRTTAGNREAWQAYAEEWLPIAPDNEGATQLESQKDTLIHQGFEAGYDAAMARVRSILAGVQSEALRENR